MRLELYRPDGTFDGVLDWDPVNGELSGAMAEQVASDVRSIVAAGGMQTHPYPTFFPIRDPLHNLTEMAVVLGTDYWRCPPELLPYWPKLPEDHSPELPPGGCY